MLRQQFVLGIDLGTTNSIGYFHDGKELRVVENNANRIVPSYIWVKNDGSIVCGDSAKSGSRNPRNAVITNSKRLIGKMYNRKEVEHVKKHCGVDVIEKGGKPVFHCVVEKNKRVTEVDITPIEAASYIIEEIVKRAKALSEKSLGKIIVTIPANFENNQRVATREAVYNVVRKEGLKESDIEIMNEPTAAGVCYGMDDCSNTNRTVLVYDFGGGTFDSSILKISHGAIQVLDHDGDPELGGADCDIGIANDLRRKYREIFGVDCMEGIPERHESTSMRSLLDFASEKKCELATAESVEVNLDEIFHLNGGNDSDDSDDEDERVFTYTIYEMNKVIRPIIEKTEVVLEHLLKSNGMTVGDIDSVVLVGGSSKLKLVSDMLKDMFGNKIKKDIDSDLCVAQGACKYLYNKYSTVPDVPVIQIEDKTRFSLGTEIVGNRVVWIIPSGSKIPCSFTQRLTTIEDWQSRVTSKVIQGKCKDKGYEESIDEDEHVLLNPYSYTGFRSELKGVPHFDTTFSYERSGIVHINVVEVETGKTLLDDDFRF